MTLTETDNPKKDARATVLVVEDDQPLLEFFSVLLRREGYRVLVASNGVEALEIANNNPDEPIDILLSDVAMPYMGGIKLAEILKEARPNIKVLLISALPVQEIISRCGPSFALDLLPKPFSVSGLSGKVKQLAAVG
ncbi:MAG: response regulator [Chloroflexi bacterium]|nr:response regulator [Chloroflexota bacterium]